MARNARRDRTLTPNERALWESVTREIDRRVEKQDHIDAYNSEKQAPKADPVEGPRARERRNHPRSQTDSAQNTQSNQVPTRLVMDRRTKQSLTRGKAAVEARLDLHGHTQDQAHAALTRFINHAVYEGKRFVIIITGKGRLSDQPGGILRHAVPHWLATPPLSRHVVGFDVAGPRDGGDGALYVQLRRDKTALR